MHALNGSAVYGKQTKNEIKWCHNCEIHIGIMIYFLCWIRQKHPHDRMAKDENSNTHEQVKSFCLNQAGAYSLTDSVLLSSTKILCHIIGNCSHHSIIYKDGKLVCFGSGSVTGYCCRSKRIYHSLHSQLSNTHNRHLEPHWKTGFQMKDCCVFQVMKIFSVKMKKLKFFHSYKQGKYSGKELGKYGSPGCSCHSHMQWEQ